MKLSIGTALDGAPLYLHSGDLATHIHGIGKSQRGKSRLMAYIARELIKAGQGVCVIDPHGSLYEGVLNWLSYVDPQLSNIILFDPSYSEKIVGFNPFLLDGEPTEEWIMTKVDHMVAATLRVWGIDELTNAPRLERWLRCLFYVLVEGGHSLEFIRFFRGRDYETIRARIVSQIRSRFIREEWEHLLGGKVNIDAQLESTMNKLFKLVSQPRVRRIMGLRENNIDISEIINRQSVLLVYLQKSEVFSDEAASIIGTLLLNEIGEVMSRRKSRKDFYVIIDEFQKFATPDLPYILDELAKYGLHLILFHQRLSNLSADVRGAMRNTDTKIIFGGVPRHEVIELLEGLRVDEEFLQQTIDHPKRYFTLKRSSQPATVCIAPPVRMEYVSEETKREYIARKLAGYLTPAQVDERIAASIEKFSPLQQLESPSTQIFNKTIEISDEDLFE